MSPAAAPATSNAKQSLSSSLNAFSFDFYGAIKGTEKGNVFLSPYSIAAALSMTNAGARGNTQAELNKALHFDQLSADGGVHAAMGSLISDLNAATKDGKPRGFRLAVANRLFGAKGATFLPDFLTVNSKQYGAPLEPLDFKNAVEPSRKAINTWVEQKTNDKVKELIQPGQLLPDAKLVLVNAIYFNADWANKFKGQATFDQPFHVAAGNDVSVPMMHGKGEYKYAEERGKLQVLELPYKGNEVSMIVLLPAEKQKLEALEKEISVENLAKWEAAMTPNPVRISLPKFKLTWGTKNVVENLQKLGIKDAFTYPQADFSGIDGAKNLVISLVLHKAFVEVKEEGTEAAAATAVLMAPGGAPPAPPPSEKVFTADRPFLFLIRDNTSGTILFIGRVANPAAA